MADGKGRKLVWITSQSVKTGKVESGYIPEDVFYKDKKYYTQYFLSGVPSAEAGNTYFGVAASEWHYTRAGAIADADRRRLKKIERLEKELERLKAMDFSVES